jgi:phosphoesterase RecJ-like protein
LSNQDRDSQFALVARRLSRAGQLLAVTHARGDGDAIGSAAALTMAARAAGKGARAALPDTMNPRYAFVCGSVQPAQGPEAFEPLADRADVIVVLDTGSWSQLDALADGIRRRRDKVVVVDHHVTGDDVASLRWIDPSAAACGVMVAQLLDELGWPVDLDTALAMAVALATDTGWLRFSNTDGRALRRMAAWLDMGLKTDELYRRLFLNDRPQRLALVARALDSLELHAGEILAVMTLTQDDFAATGAMAEETENIVNEAMRIASVEAALLFIEQSDGQVRVNLRSRGRLDVAALAGGFGGGGHPRAAGARLRGPVAQVKAQVVGAALGAM